MSNLKRRVFVIGSHRTGTRSLAKYFQTEDGRHVRGIHAAKGLRFLYVLSNMTAVGHCPPRFLKKMSHQILDPFIPPGEDSVSVLANGYCYLAAAGLMNDDPQIRVIHVIRDPRDFIRSFINWKNQRWQSRLAHHMIPYWNITAPLAGEMSLTEWRGLSDIGRYGWMWADKNKRIFEAYAGFGDRFLTIRFEDLFAQGDSKALTKVMAFAGLDQQEIASGISQRLNASDKRNSLDWRLWSEEDCRCIDQFCGSLMRSFDYGHEAQWQNKISQPTAGS